MKKLLIILAIFILAFSVRFAYIIGNPGEIDSDEKEYDRLATGLLGSKTYLGPNGLPTSHRPPLYPAFLALIYAVSRHSIFIAKLIQAIVGSLTVCFLYLIAERIFNRTTAIITAAFSSFYMTFVVCTNLLYSETLFTFLLVLATFLAIKAEKKDVIWFCILGFISGLLTLTRSTGFFVPFIISALIFLKSSKSGIPMRKIARLVLILILCFAATISVWTIRNYKVHRNFVLISANAGLNMYQAVNPVDGKIFGLGPRDEVAVEAWKIADEVKRDKFLMSAAFDVYRRYPERILRLFIMRLLFFWNVIDWEIIGGETVNFHFIFILPFTLLGMIYSKKEKKEIALIAILIIYFTAFVLFFQGTPRYRMPIDGYIIILGSYGIYTFAKRYKNKIYPILTIGIYFLFTYLLFLNSATTKDILKNLLEGLGLW